jgi:hypothetical protein
MQTQTHKAHRHTHRFICIESHCQASSNKLRKEALSASGIYNLVEFFCLLAQVTDVGTKAFDCGKHAPASAHVQLLQKRDCKNYLIKKSDGGIILE